jgi:putative component of membrane protein insertase Oxa1/YidC/SpoIIIJ protein YidD
MGSTKEQRANRRHLWSGAPDCPVHQRTPNSNPSPSGISRGNIAIIHRTVRCTPDMSGAPRESGLRNSPASGILFGCFAIIHRTVRCNSGATAISAPTATCDALNARAARAEVRHAHTGAPRAGRNARGSLARSFHGQLGSDRLV